MIDEEVNAVLYHYPVFSFTKKIDFIFRKSVIRQSLFVWIFTIIAIIGASALDHTFVLGGKDVGLFEHPTIWMFLLIQILIPVVFKNAVGKLFDFFKYPGIIDSNKRDLSIYSSVFVNHVSRKTNFSKIIYALSITIGFICLVWNSFQNQAPYKFLGFDFWDSFNHPYGYWITRLYKVYLWVLLFPAAIHIQISILFVLYKLLKDAVKDKLITLKPYNRDEYAGIGNVIKIAIAPPIPILIVATLSVLSAFLIHGGSGATPIIGSTILSLLFLAIYLIPAIQLRKIINSEKKRQLDEIAETQNTLYYTLVKNDNPHDVFENLETLNALTPVYKKIKSISSWPYLKLFLKIVAFINIPGIISICKSIWPLVKH
jgi:hypothetical protein